MNVLTEDRHSQSEFKLLDQLDLSHFITHGHVILDICFPALTKAVFGDNSNVRSNRVAVVDKTENV